MTAELQNRTLYRAVSGLSRKDAFDACRELKQQTKCIPMFQRIPNFEGNNSSSKKQAAPHHLIAAVQKPYLLISKAQFLCATQRLLRRFGH